MKYITKTHKHYSGVELSAHRFTLRDNKQKRKSCLLMMPVFTNRKLQIMTIHREQIGNAGQVVAPNMYLDGLNALGVQSKYLWFGQVSSLNSDRVWGLFVFFIFLGLATVSVAKACCALLQVHRPGRATADCTCTYAHTRLNAELARAGQTDGSPAESKEQWRN